MLLCSCAMEVKTTPVIIGRVQFIITMASTCLVCYEESEIFVLPPCSHTHICWKCCLKLVEGSIFSCPFCKNHSETKSHLLFVNKDEMETSSYNSIMKSNPFRSNKNTFYFYSNEQVAKYIEAETSFHCTVCGQVHETLNMLKKHLNSSHKRQFCDVCLDNRRCIVAEQRLFSEPQIQAHMRQGDISQTGEVVLYHPNCQFCQRRYYDLDSFKMHLKMSSHLRCDICDVNNQRLKHVYYKNYDELERHHKKTHFVCDVGDCIAQKLENVFASEALLEEHKRRCHRKYKGSEKPEKKIQNIILGFNKTVEEEVIAFDGIGKNLEKQFAIFDRQEKVQKQPHSDGLIDIREFYPDMIRAHSHAKPDDMHDRLRELHEDHGTKSKDVHFNDVYIFKPLEMPSLTRIELERLMKRCFPHRQAEAICEIFFTKRGDYLSFGQYFTAIQKRMRGYSHFAFYIAFPQLIRFMKDQNKNKQPMDLHYALKLRQLKVGRMFIFHTFEKYSQMLQFLKARVEEQLVKRCQEGNMDLDKYCKHLREMNGNFYFSNQDDLYYVSRDKVTNLYHMIERCKTKDFLRLNWLLKIGFTQQSYHYISKNFYYRTKEECEQRLFEHFNVKELALINLYTLICLQALLDPRTFEASKRDARAHFFTDFLASVTAPTKIPKKYVEEMKILEGGSIGIEKKMKQGVRKSLIVEQDECPSLLDLRSEPPQRRKPPETLEVGLGKSRLPIWNEEEAIRKKAPPIKPKVQTKQDDEFPSLPAKNGRKEERKDQANIEDDEFPVFNFKEKFVKPVTKALEKKQKQAIDFVSFNSRAVVPNRWDEDKTRIKFQQITKDEPEPTPKPMKKVKQTKPELKPEIKAMIKKEAFIPPSDEEDEGLNWAIKQSLKLSNQQELLVNKKNKAEEDVGKKKKYKKVNQSLTESPKKVQVKEDPKQKMNSSLIFEQIQQEAEVLKKPKAKKFRVDSSESEQEVKPASKTNNIKAAIATNKMPVIWDDDFEPIKDTYVPPPAKEANKPKKQSKKQQVAFNQDEFESIGSKPVQKESIINRLIKQGSLPEESLNNKVVRNGKKGKKVVIETVKWF